MERSDGLPVETLKESDDERELDTHGLFYESLVAAWRGRRVPRRRKDATVEVLIEKKIGRSMAIIVVFTSWHTLAIIVLLRVIAGRFYEFGKRDSTWLNEECAFRPERSTVNIMMVVRRLQELALKKDITLYLCFIDLKYMFPSTERFCGLSLLLFACHRQGLPLSANSTKGWKHACVHMVRSARTFLT